MSRADGATLPLPLDTDDPVRALGRRIRTLRVAAFLTQDGLARRARLSRDTIARLEFRHRNAPAPAHGHRHRPGRWSRRRPGAAPSRPLPAVGGGGA